MKVNASAELRMCVSMAAAGGPAHSASNVLELPESKSKLNASSAFVCWNPIESCTQKNLKPASVIQKRK